MKTLYLMRHGETLFNVHHKNQGWCDSPLTERGHAQARIAGRHLRELSVHPDHFFSSTSERASDTLEDVCLEALARFLPMSGCAASRSGTSAPMRARTIS